VNVLRTQPSREDFDRLVRVAIASDQNVEQQQPLAGERVDHRMSAIGIEEEHGSDPLITAQAYQWPCGGIQSGRPGGTDENPAQE